MEKQSYCQGLQPKNWKELFYWIKLWFAYRHYRRFIQHSMVTHSKIAKGRETGLIVDIGCGNGFLLRFLEKWFPLDKIVGLDCDFRVLDCARNRVSRSLVLQGYADQLSFRDGEVTVIVALHVIEHLYHPENFLAEAGRVLERDGVLLMATPNPKGIGSLVMKSRWTGWREDHVSLYSPEDWINLIERHGFTPIRVGTTGLSGIPVFCKSPLAILNYLPLLIFGVLPWNHGEAFVGLFRHRGKAS